MKTNPALLSLVLLAFAGQSFAHRLDEYLQATTISLEKDRIAVDMRLSPGVAVASVVLAAIDRNNDGSISSAEQAAYVDQLLRDISLTLDGNALRLRLISMTFARVEDMREGMGEIHLEFLAAIPRQDIAARQLLFESSHQKQFAAYLVNAIVPSDPDIRITGQSRNFQQSSYRLDYLQAGTSAGPFSLASWSGQRAWLIALALLMTIRFAYLSWRRLARLISCGRLDPSPDLEESICALARGNCSRSRFSRLADYLRRISPASGKAPSGTLIPKKNCGLY